MRNRRIQAVIMVAAACICTARIAGAQKPDANVADIVSRVIEAYGGEKAMHALHGYYASGNQWAAQRDEPMRAQRWFARPDRLRLDLDYPDHHEIRITDGDVGWLGSSPQDLAPAIPVKLLAMRLQTARLDLPLRLLEHQGEIEPRGTDPQGRTVLRIPIDASLRIDYHVDPATWRITRVTTGMAQPPLEFVADYEQFHAVDGVLVPFREVTYAGGTLTAKFQLTEFVWNPKDLERNLDPAAGSGD
ncbi:MAG TPA: hypothetical protein VF247_03725 [Candidatus Krumholzibacteria bacterium]